MTIVSGVGTVVIPSSEMERIKNSLVPDEISKEQSRRIELQKISKARAGTWTNTLAGSRRIKAQQRLERLEAEEKARQEMDEIEAAHMIADRKKVILRANALVFNEADRSKAFHSQMMYSDVIAEREAQIELKNELGKLESLRDERYEEMDKQNYRKMLERELSEKRVLEEKTKHQSEAQQAQRNEKIRKAQVAKEQGEREGMLIRLKACEDLENEKKLNVQRRKLEIENSLGTLKVADYLKELKAADQERFEKEDKKILEYAEHKRMMGEKRKQKEFDIKKAKLDSQQKLIDRQSKLLSEMKNLEESRIQSQVEQKDAEERKKQADKDAEKARWEADILTSRMDQIDRKRMERMSQINQEAEVAQFWTEYVKQMQDEEKSDKLLRYRECKDLQRAHLKQAELNKRRAREHKRVEDKVCHAAKLKMEKDDMNFHTYAEGIIREYAEDGKNVIPIVKTLKSFYQDKL